MSSLQNADTIVGPDPARKTAHKRPGLLGTGIPRTLHERRRAIRVWMLVALIIVLSLADLYMTLAHLRSAGMGEDNPLARLVMSYQSPLILGAWKGACVALACLILVLARFRRSGEIACWVCCAVLTMLTVRWANYASEASAFTAQINSARPGNDTGNWVTMAPDGP